MGLSIENLITNIGKEVLQGLCKQDGMGLVGDGVTDDIIAFGSMMSKIPNGATIDFGNNTYYFSAPAIIPSGKKNITFLGACTIIGRIQIGSDDGYSGIAFNFRIQDFFFDHTTFPLTQDAISIINATDVDIENVKFKRVNACVRIMEKTPLPPPFPVQPSTHTARVKVHNCQVIPDISTDPSTGQPWSPNVRFCNWNVFVDNIDKVNPKFVAADCKIENNVQMFANTCNVEAYGVDGLELMHNTLFLPGGTYMSQTKTNNVKIIVANWSKVNDNNVFEAGEAGIWVDRFQNGNINDNNIAWPGQRDQTKGYGVLVTGAGYPDAAYNDLTVDCNIINIPTKAGIWMESSGFHVGSNIVKAPGNVSHYYGTGTKIDPNDPEKKKLIPGAMGDGLCIPLLDQLIVSAGGWLDTVNDGLFIGNICSEKNWDFPVNETVAEAKRPRNFLNRQTGSIVEFTSGSAVIITGNSIDVSNVSEIVLTLPANSSIATITGGNIGQQVTLYNGGNNVTITNSATLILKGFTDVVIPFRGSITLKRRVGGVWKEIARTMIEESVLVPQLVSDLNAVTKPFSFFYSTSGAANSPATGFAQGIQFAANNDPNFKMELIMTGTPSVFLRSSNGSVWGTTYRLEYKSIYSVRTGGAYFPNFQNETIEVIADNTDIALSQDSTTVNGVTKVFKNSSNTAMTVTPNTNVTINGNTAGTGRQSIPAGGRLELVASSANVWRIVSLTIDPTTTTPIIDTTTTAYTKATINAAYPNAKLGQIINAASITTGGVLYMKKDNSPTGDWTASPSVTLT